MDAKNSGKKGESANILDGHVRNHSPLKGSVTEVNVIVTNDPNNKESVKKPYKEEETKVVKVDVVKSEGKTAKAIVKVGVNGKSPGLAMGKDTLVVTK